MMIRVLFSLTALACIPAASEIISFQGPATGEEAYLSQEFTGNYAFLSTYQLDDLDLGSPGYRLTDVTVYFYAGRADYSFFEFKTYSELPRWTEDPLIKEYHADWARWEGEFYAVHFDLEGDAYSGLIWCAAYTTQPLEEYWTDEWWTANAHEPVGSEQYVWFWGAGQPPVPGSWEYGLACDMSWKIEGTPVPEPALVPLVVALALSAAHLRRKGM